MITRVSLGSQGSRNHNNNVCLTFHVTSVDFQDNLNMMQMRAYMPSAYISFTNSLDPDQARQNVGPESGSSNCLTL